MLDMKIHNSCYKKRQRKKCNDYEVNTEAHLRLGMLLPFTKLLDTSYVFADCEFDFDNVSSPVSKLLWWS